jgi:dCMP deaminase
MRPHRSLVFMKVAIEIAHLGTCDRARVGAVIVRDGRCVSWGYNGAPPGLPHCDENNHGWQEYDWPAGEGRSPKLWEDQMIREHGCRNATHAEANALAFAAKQGISTDKAQLFVTVSPCDTCSRLLIAAGIESVVYKESYRDKSGIELLYAAGVELVHLGG